MTTTRRADMFTADGKPSDDDPREHRPRLGDERGTLADSLRRQRLASGPAGEQVAGAGDHVRRLAPRVDDRVPGLVAERLPHGLPVGAVGDQRAHLVSRDPGAAAVQHRDVDVRVVSGFDHGTSSEVGAAEHEELHGASPSRMARSRSVPRPISGRGGGSPSA